MNDGLIPNRYAKALFKVAVEKAEQDTLYAQMKQLVASFDSTPALKAAVNNPFIAVDEKEKVLLTAAGAKKGSTLENFILLVIEKNRASFLRSMALAYLKLYREAFGIASVEIVTAIEMTDSEISGILDVVKRQLGDKKMEKTVTVDSSLIGGFTVNVDGQVLDASIKNELKKLRLKLLS
ncbi:MAG: ATP synthase F1 subunit delta [Bacteroidales bacterium]|nr:ATP synthase F1 subunit delta [Bacteroidales bacterium]